MNQNNHTQEQFQSLIQAIAKGSFQPDFTEPELRDHFVIALERMFEAPKFPDAQVALLIAKMERRWEAEDLFHMVTDIDPSILKTKANIYHFADCYVSIYNPAENHINNWRKAAQHFVIYPK